MPALKQHNPSNGSKASTRQCGPQHTEQEEEQAQNFTPAGWPHRRTYNTAVRQDLSSKLNTHP
eukprot:1156415-Pelagomonas_calceolata.AAC.1